MKWSLYHDLNNCMLGYIDEEEDDEEESKAESVKIPAVSKEVEKSNLNKRTALAPFDWSAASARMEKNRNSERIKETEWLPPMSTVVLSQEIISPSPRYVPRQRADCLAMT
ncbi:hypothetical protein ACTXT7_002885 [Hymenolepis weldensis]